MGSSTIKKLEKYPDTLSRDVAVQPRSECMQLYACEVNAKEHVAELKCTLILPEQLWLIIALLHFICTASAVFLLHLCGTACQTQSVLNKCVATSLLLVKRRSLAK